MNDPVLRASGLRKAYRSGGRRIVAVDGVDLTVDFGEVVAVTGPSGSGKTTLLHCLAGVMTPDEGEVILAGEPLFTLDEAGRSELRRRRMGFVFQRLNLLPPLSVSENIQLPLVLRGDDRRDIQERTDQVLDLVGLAGRGDARPRDLSGGEMQRVAIARAVATQPDIVWADEPTGQLDSENADRVGALLADLAAAGTTVVLVTHDEAVAAHASRRLRLVDGRLQDR